MNGESRMEERKERRKEGRKVGRKEGKQGLKNEDEEVKKWQKFGLQIEGKERWHDGKRIHVFLYMSIKFKFSYLIEIKRET